ncbi:MAG TPA: 50S ribosomal protein L4 [Acidobacteriota bacterium]|nr:50S ribosomal protein L4 [Acidobacteriota bacterium]
MAQVEVKNLKNKVVEKLDLDPAVFQYQASDTLVWEAVQAYMAAQRKGTHSTKTRGRVRGSGRKLWRQKGTGRARVGSIRTPLWRSGGTVHGPTPRSYAQAFPKKKRRGAVKRVLSDKLESGRLVVIDDLALDSPRTKDFLQALKALDLGNKVLVVDERDNRNLYLGSRNLPQVKMVTTLGVNVYDLLDHETLLISKRSLLALQDLLLGKRTEAAAETAEEGESQ